MIVSLDKLNIKAGLALYLTAVAVAIGASSPAFSQEVTPDPEDKEVAASQDSPEKPVEEKSDEAKKSVKKAPVKKGKVLYDLRRGPLLKRQTGPARSAPKSIIPKPFIAKGSIAIPLAPVSPLPSEDKSEISDPLVDGKTIADQVSDDTLGQETTSPDTTLDSAMPFGEEESSLNEVETGALDQLDPSLVALISEAEGGVPQDFWAGYDRQKVINTLKHYEKVGGSAVVGELANSFALSGVDLPATSGPYDTIAYLKSRLNLLQARGNVAGFNALLDALPEEGDWSLLDKDLARKAIISGRRVEVCALAQAKLGSDQDSYWLRLLAFCNAVIGNRPSVDFQMSILDEFSAVDPAFYKLIDHILIEAETGTTLTSVPTLNSPMPVKPLEASLVALSRAKVGMLDLDAIDPMAVPMVLAAPGVAASAKADLVGKSLNEGWISSQTLEEFIRNYQPSENDILSAFDLFQIENSFIIDMTLAHVSAAGSDISQRLRAINYAWSRAVRKGFTTQVAPAYARLVADIIPTADVLEDAGAVIRLALMAGDNDLARRWINMLRQMPVGINEKLDRILLDVYPLALVSGFDDLPPPSASHFNSWMREHSQSDDLYYDAAMLATLTEALGDAVPQSIWQKLEEGPAVYDKGTAAPALWRNMAVADLKNDRAGVLAASVRLVIGASPARIPPTLAGAMIATLIKHDFETVARRMAAEILISRGL